MTLIEKLMDNLRDVDLSIIDLWCEYHPAAINGRVKNGELWTCDCPKEGQEPVLRPVSGRLAKAFVDHINKAIFNK